MDGVLADFFAGFQRLDPSVKSEEDMKQKGDTDVYDRMMNTDFYYTLKPYPTANKLIHLVLQYVPEYFICSSPLRGDYNNSKYWKLKWIHKYLFPQPKRIIIVDDKEHYATQSDHTPNILIDDRLKNLNPWINAGGIGIHYQASKDNLTKVEQMLGELIQ